MILNLTRRTRSLPKRLLSFVRRTSRLYSQLAEHYARVGSLDDSLATIEKGIEIAPENNEFKKQKARILVGLGRKDEARTIYEKVQRPVRQPLAQVDRGHLCLIGDHDAAIDATTPIDKYSDRRQSTARSSTSRREYDKAADANQALRHNANSLPALLQGRRLPPDGKV